MPWSRGYNLIQSDKKTSLFAMTRTETRENLFKWVGPISNSRIVVSAKKSKNLKINNITDLNNIKIGAVRDDIGEQLLLENNIGKANIETTGDNISNIRKLDKNRIDAFAYDENVFRYTAKSLGLNTDEYETIAILKQGQVFFAFSKDVSDEDIKTLQSTLDSLVKDGTYEKILNKYLK